MILTIKPVTVGSVTTDKAILNMSVGDSSVAISLYPAVEVNGEWVKVEGAPVLPIVGLASETDISALLESFSVPVQTLIDGRGV